MATKFGNTLSSYNDYPHQYSKNPVTLTLVVLAVEAHQGLTSLIGQKGVYTRHSSAILHYLLHHFSYHYDIMIKIQKAALSLRVPVAQQR